MPVVEIHYSSERAPKPESLAGCYLDAPKAGTASDFYAIQVMGWALGAESPVVAVEFMDGPKMIHRTSMNLARPDVAKLWPAAPDAENCGFKTSIGLLWAPLEFEISVRAVFANDRREEFGKIGGRREPVRGSYQSQLQPLMITTLGRTGSTWVTRLLSQHPQITAYRPFLFEPRVLSYWTEILRTIAAPASALQSVFGTNLMRRDWWLTPEPAEMPDLGVLDPEMQESLALTSVQALGDLCLSRIDDFYIRAARLQGNEEPTYFAEKIMPTVSRDIILELYPRAKEIVLVRDFRDMAASIFAFNAKRNYLAFGRERFASDAEYIADCLRPDALVLLRAWKSRAGQSFLLRYEDIIAGPHETLAKVLAHLGLDSSDAVIARMIEQAPEGVPEAEQHRTSADPARSIGRWRTDLPPSLHPVCAEAFGEVLREFGYETDDHD